MNPGWISVVVALVGIAGVMGGRLWNGGRREERMTASIERLTDLAEDHEDRLRYLEHRPPRLDHPHRHRHRA